MTQVEKDETNKKLYDFVMRLGQDLDLGSDLDEIIENYDK